MRGRRGSMERRSWRRRTSTSARLSRRLRRTARGAGLAASARARHDRPSASSDWWTHRSSAARPRRPSRRVCAQPSMAWRPWPRGFAADAAWPPRAHGSIRTTTRPPHRRRVRTRPRPSLAITAPCSPSTAPCRRGPRGIADDAAPSASSRRTARAARTSARRCAGPSSRRPAAVAASSRRGGAPFSEALARVQRSHDPRRQWLPGGSPAGLARLVAKLCS
mmetsp:Transcript_115122/g.332580  ORF Transcript_115122/g.332580 Transcript_115122/m.332580 type:complete len:221 (+) Transcript_115122:445-1107(+)